MANFFVYVVKSMILTVIGVVVQAQSLPADDGFVLIDRNEAEIEGGGKNKKKVLTLTPLVFISFSST